MAPWVKAPDSKPGAWGSSLGPTWGKGRTNSPKLSFHLQTVHPHPQINVKCNKKNNQPTKYTWDWEDSQVPALQAWRPEWGGSPSPAQTWEWPRSPIITGGQWRQEDPGLCRPGSLAESMSSRLRERTCLKYKTKHQNNVCVGTAQDRESRTRKATY